MSTLKHEVIRLFAKYASWPLKIADVIIHKEPSEDRDPVFIIGVPRSGSTILYQVLTNYFDVRYFDNLVHLFHRNAETGFWLSDRIFKDAAHNCYTSDLGNTFACGLRAPSECGQFWQKWLSKEKHYYSVQDATDPKYAAIKRILLSVNARYDKPLVIKNLVLSQRLNLIHRLFPKAKLVYVKRNPLDTAFSIIQARKKLGLDNQTWWSVRPKNYEQLLGLPEYELVVKQVFYLERQIHKDLKLFTRDAVHTLDYDGDFMNNFESCNKNLQLFLGSPELRKNIIPFKPAIRQRTSSEILKKLQAEIDKMDWDSYADK